MGFVEFEMIGLNPICLITISMYQLMALILVSYHYKLWWPFPQGSVLGPLLFLSLLYWNILYYITYII